MGTVSAQTPAVSVIGRRSVQPLKEPSTSTLDSSPPLLRNEKRWSQRRSLSVHTGFTGPASAPPSCPAPTVPEPAPDPEPYPPDGLGPGSKCPPPFGGGMM